MELITEFDHLIGELGPLGESEGLDRTLLMRKLRAARMAVESMRLRMSFAKQAKKIKEDNSYGVLPDPDKLMSTCSEEIHLYETLICLRDRQHTLAELTETLDLSADRVTSIVETLKKKNLWEGELLGA